MDPSYILNQGKISRRHRLNGQSTFFLKVTRENINSLQPYRPQKLINSCSLNLRFLIHQSLHSRLNTLALP